MDHRPHDPLLRPEAADGGPRLSGIYAEAKEALNSGAYENAIKYFERLESRYLYGRYAQQAQLEIAYAYWKSQEHAQAIAACDRFIKLHPNHERLDYVYYLKGLINFNEDLGLLGSISQQDMTERDPKGARESFDAFRELVTRFPDSKYTPDATLRMKYLVNALATLEVHVARYYMKRGAYLAAANRAQYAIQNYPHRVLPVHPTHWLPSAQVSIPAPPVSVPALVVEEVLPGRFGVWVWGLLVSIPGRCFRHETPR